MPTNPVATFTLPINTTQLVTTYKANIDGGFAVAQRIIDQFAPHQAANPNMTVVIDAGSIFNGTSLTEVAQQTSGTITAPTGSNKRIDRIVISASAGTISVITGTPTTGTPTAPAIPAGNLPIAQTGTMTSSTTAITNAMITDERNFWGLPTSGVTTGSYTTANITVGADGRVTAASNGTSGIGSLNVQSFTSSGTYTPTSGMLYCIIEMWGGGGGGGGVVMSGSGIAGGGGGAGGYSRLIASAATIGASQTVTIGAGGAAGSNGAGGSGGTTSLGSLLTAGGGSGGSGGTGGNGEQNGGAGGSGTCLGVTTSGAFGGIGAAGGAISFGGYGGSTSLGGGGQAPGGTNAGGSAVANSGGGGAGGAAVTGSQSGGSGGSGLLVITEYI